MTNLKSVAIAVCSVLIICIGGFYLWEQKTKAETYRPSPQNLLDGQAIAILKGATHVDTLRIATPEKRGRELRPHDPHLARFFVLGQGQHLGQTQANAITSNLLEPENYPPYGKACISDPGVAFRFWRGKESVLIAVCFECGIVEAITLDARSHVMRTGYSEFSAGLLVPEAKQGFPNDPIVHSLRAARSNNALHPTPAAAFCPALALCLRGCCRR